jgi:hypothetical protein
VICMCFAYDMDVSEKCDHLMLVGSRDRFVNQWFWGFESM